MPGIVAVVDDVHGEELLHLMMKSMKHRDSYLLDSYASKKLAIGRVHLGIFNPEPQPIFNEDKSLGIFMDGKIYDYAEEKERLRLKGHKFTVDNDAEFCLHKFEEYGESFVNNLNGSFVMAIFNVENHDLLIANDRHGSKPLFYAKNDGKYLFASEVKAILQDKTFKKEVDDSAVAEFFAFSRLLGCKTLFKGINALRPASMAVLSNGKLGICRYWNVSFEKECSTAYTEEYHIKKLVHSLRKAVRRRMEEQHSYGVFLSGGVDSRSVAVEVNRQRSPTFTFTYGVEKGEEARIAEKVAKKLGTRHTFIKQERDFFVRFAEEGVYLTDGMCNCYSFNWTKNVLDRVNRDVDVVFHGLGLDYLGGWPISIFQIVDRQILKAPEKHFAHLVYKKFNNLISDENMPLFFSNNYYKKIEGIPQKSLEEELAHLPPVHPLNKLIAFSMNSARRGAGRAVLRSFLEEEMPAWDNCLIDAFFEIPPELRLEHKIYYKFLTFLAPNLTWVPYEATSIPPIAPLFVHRLGTIIKGVYKMLARKLRNVTKGLISLPEISLRGGYPDIDEILRDAQIRRFFESVLLNERTMSRGYFNRGYIAKMIEDHMSYKKDYGTQLCALLTFELWHRLFMD